MLSHIESCGAIKSRYSSKMAHLIKMFMKNTSLPPRISQRRLVSRSLVTGDAEMILDEKTKSGNQEEPAKKQRKKLLVVRLKRPALRVIRSITGISVTPFAIGWAQIDVKNMSLLACSGEILDTQNVHITEDVACTKIKEVKSLIPQSDVYIFERQENFSRKKGEIVIPIMLSSMLAVLLHDPTGPLDESNIYFQDKSVIDKLYNLMVKRERVSVCQVLQRKLGGSIQEQYHSGKSDITLNIDDVTLSTTRNIMQNVLSSKPLKADVSAVAFFTALSVVHFNFRST